MHKDFIELTERVEELSEDELKRANKEFPMFHSRHEALGVLSEELWELSNEIEMMNKYTEEIQISTFTDDDSEKIKKNAEKAYNHAIRLTAEAIQVCAMFKKLIQSEMET